MFELRCIVADKRLPEALRALKSLALESPVTIPVDDKPVTGQKTGSVELLITWLKKSKPKKVTAAAMRGYLEHNGYSKNGYSYAQKMLLEKGILKKTKEYATYEVV